MKIPENVKTFAVGFIGFMAICALVFLAIICTGCSRSTANAQGDTPSQKIVKLQYQIEKQQEIISAYGFLLHQVWLDKPTYVEEALTESDEYAQLNELLDSEWGDVFKFHSREDSITYYMNWDSVDGSVRIIRHIVGTKAE